MSSIKLQLTPSGCIRMLWDDAIDLKQFGPVEVSRASHVEFDNETGLWYVQSAKTLKVLKDDFTTRVKALAWEKVHYSPGGAGWHELTEENI
jgi:hypothetical protein